MAIRKEHDWVGVNLSNPSFTNTDFKDIGINTTNTSIGPESAYINNAQIRQLPEFLTNGKFDLSKFHLKYVELAKTYNDLAQDTYSRDLKNQGRIFAENDIFVSPEERRLGSEVFMTLINNPDHITYGIVGVDTPGPRTKTPMELAEGHPIFDSKTGKFTEETPENSLLKYFWRPKMMATYDTDVDINGNPTTDPTKIAHVKGEYKLTEDGEYYTEFVNGKSTYGKELVSSWNILTKEDSPLNKYDPFDSDDIKKSTAGSIARNALKILPLLTPVAPYYAAASIGINLVDAIGTLGKLVAGSLNSTLNDITAFAEQFNLTTSEEGMKHSFSLENILNMVGDTFMFLESLRILAEQAPKLFNREAARIMKDPDLEIRNLTGNYIRTQSSAIERKYAELEKTVLDKAELEFEKAEELRALSSIAATRASAIVSNLVNNFNKLGRQISTSMMALTFGLHTYGVAKAQGVSDEAATALTLGAIAGQYGLLSSHIGLKIFPEATLEKQQVVKALDEYLSFGRTDGSYRKAIMSFEKAGTKEAKERGVKTLFAKGKDLSESIWNVLNSIPSTIIASTAATGIEMLSFTALDDLIASIYNLALWVSGDTTSPRMSAWEDIAGRYGTSLIGGGIAGAITAPKIYRNAQKIRNMSRPLAFDLIIHMINEGKEGELIKEIDKHTWGSKDLSVDEIARRELSSGEYEVLYGTGTPENNQNEEIKKIMKDTIYDLKNILNTYGTIISKDSLLNIMVNGKNITKDLRLAALKQSNFALAFLEDYIDNQLDIYTEAKELSLDSKSRLERGETDEIRREINQFLRDLESSKSPAEYQEKLDEAAPEESNEVKHMRNLRQALKINREFLSGKKHAEFVKKALFEMLPGLHSAFMDIYFRDWVEKKRGKTFDSVSLADKKEDAKLFYYLRSGKDHMQDLEGAFHKFELSNNIVSDGINHFKSIVENKDLKEFLTMFNELSIAVKNHLFGVFDVKAGVTNPYEMEEASKYSLSTEDGRNTPLRPEQVVGAVNFPGYAYNKRAYDQYYLIKQLFKRYKIGEEGAKAIFDLLNNLQTYYEFVERLRKETDAKVLNYPKELADWEARRGAWEANAENEGKPFEEEIPEQPKPFTSATIKAAIQEMLDRKKTLETEDKKIPESLRAIRKAEQKPFEIFEKLYQFIDANKESTDHETLKTVRAALLILDNLLHYKTIGDDADELKAKSKVTREKLLNSRLNSTVQRLIAFTIGRNFLEELNTLLGKEGGYLNDFQREQIKNLISDISSYLSNNSEHQVQDILVEGETVNVFDLLDVLNIIPFGSDAGKDIRQISNIINDRARESAQVEELIELADEVADKVDNYNTDGMLAVADKLMLELTGIKDNPKNGVEGKKVSSILKRVQKQINAKTDPFNGFGMDRKTATDLFILSKDLIADMDLAILVLQMVRSSYAAATEEVKSVFNHVGYNATVNKIMKETGRQEGKQLATLSLELVAEGIKNIEDSIYKLLYWKEVAANAMMLRTQITDKADLAYRLNLMTQVIGKIEKSGWNGIERFKSEVEKLSKFNSLRNEPLLTRLNNVTEEELNQVIKELFRFEKLLYDFFLTNIDKVNNIQELAKFINEGNFALTNTVEPITVKDTFNDDNSIIWYLATVCSLDPEVFYSNLKESLLRDRLPVALQTQWKYTVFSFCANLETFSKFRLALLESKKAKYPKLNSDNVTERIEEQKRFAREVLSLTTNIRRTNSLLVSSGPGFGKSTYVPELIKLLENGLPNFNKETDLWISGPEKPKETNPNQMALDMVKKIGAKNTPAFTRESLMRMILKDYDEYEKTFKVTNGKLTTDKTLELNFDDGSIKFPFELNDGIQNLPKIILIDEISDFSLFDIDVLDTFARKNNIKLLLHGDFMQSGVYGKVKVNEGDNIIAEHELGLSDVEFMRTPKSLISYRSANTQTDKNNAILRAFTDTYLKYLYKLAPNPPQRLELSYYVDKNTGDLYGTYVEENNSKLSDTTKEYIEGMYRSLKEGEEVVLLYGDDNSIAYKFINGNDAWAKRTDFKKGSTIKSTENKYYIIDLNGIEFDAIKIDDKRSDIERVIREYYTALTRLEQGSIIIDNLTSKVPNVNLGNGGMDSNTTIITMPEKFIAKRSEKFALLLNSEFKETKKLADADTKKEIKKKDPDKKPLKEKKPQGIKTDLRKVDLDEVEQDGDQMSFKDFSDDSLQMYRRQEEKRPLVIDRKKGTRKLPGTTAGASSYETPDEFIEFILHTFNALRTGFASDGDKIFYSNHADERRDCVNGLRYIDSLLREKGTDLEIPNLDNPNAKTEEKVIEYLSKIHSLVRSKNNKEIKRELFELLQLGELTIDGQKFKLSDLDIRYGLVTYPEYWETKKGKKLDTNPYIYVDREKEKLWGGKGSGSKNNTINRKELVLIIGKNGKEASDTILLTVPILTLPNYQTVYAKGRDSLPKEITDGVDRINKEMEPGHERDLEIAKFLRELLFKNPDIKGAAALLKLIETYCLTSNSIYLLNSDTQLVKTPDHKNGLFDHLGWFISASDRGFDYDVDGYELTSREYNKPLAEIEEEDREARYILHDVEELANEKDKDVSHIYTFVNESGYKELTDNNGTTIKTGAYYVLVADKGPFRDILGNFIENSMVEYFKNQLIDPENYPTLVKLFAVRPPEADFDTFIESEYEKIFKSKDDPDRRLDIGNQFTIYRILQKVFLASEKSSDNPVEVAGKAILALRDSNVSNVDNIRNHILRLSYMEGILSNARREKIQSIFNLANEELKPGEKLEIEAFAKDYKSIDSPTAYVSAISAYMKTKVTADEKSVLLRTALRRFLLILYNPRRMTNNPFPFWESYDETALQKFIKEAASDQALLYNPYPIIKDDVKYPLIKMPVQTQEGKTSTIEFKIVPVTTDLNNPYTYKDKNFTYASTIYSGPFVGNVMAIVDLVLNNVRYTTNDEGQKIPYGLASGGFSPKADRINVFDKRTHKSAIKLTFYDSTIKEAAKYYVKNIPDDITEALLNAKLNPVGLYAILHEKGFYILSIANLPEGTKNMHPFTYKDFDEKDKLLTLSHKNSDIILKTTIQNGSKEETRFYKLLKSGDNLLLEDITKPEIHDPWNQEFKFKKRVWMNQGAVTIEEAADGSLLATIETPLNEISKVLFNNDKFFIENNDGSRREVTEESDREQLRMLFNGEATVDIIEETPAFIAVDAGGNTLITLKTDVEISEINGILDSIVVSNNKVYLNYLDKDTREQIQIEGQKAIEYANKYIPESKKYTENILIDPIGVDKKFIIPENSGLRMLLSEATEDLYQGENLSVSEVFDILGASEALGHPDIKTIASMIDDPTYLNELGEEFKNSFEKYKEINCI